MLAPRLGYSIYFNKGLLQILLEYLSQLCNPVLSQIGWLSRWARASVTILLHALQWLAGLI